MNKRIYLFTSLILISAFSGTAISQEMGIREFEGRLPIILAAHQMGKGWGEQSMNMSVMILAATMLDQIAAILKDDNLSRETQEELSLHVGHLAEILNRLPQLIIGKRPTDSKMIQDISEMIKMLEDVRKKLRNTES